MLKTYLKNKPYTSFVIIQDSVTQKGDIVLDHLINQHLKESSVVNFCQFQYNRGIGNKSWFNSINRHSFLSDVQENDKLLQVLSLELKNSIVVIDSLIHLVFKYGLNAAYQILQKIKLKRPKQIISILHSEVFSEYKSVFDYAKHLSTLFIKLEPRLLDNQDLRMSYIYKKEGGKVMIDVEQYCFEHGNLVTKPVVKLEVKSLIKQSTILPETLTTFKISLNAKEKQDRDQLQLPYLPKEENNEKESGGGNIFYKFDEVDDWDEEDPDDDLDF